MAAAASQTTTLSTSIAAQSGHRRRLSSSSTKFPRTPFLPLRITLPTRHRHRHRHPHSLPTAHSLPFLTPDEASTLHLLQSFRYRHAFASGPTLEIRLMAPEEIDPTVEILVESFGDWLRMPGGYQKLLAFLVKQYVMERRSALPHAATLVGIYRSSGDDENDEGGRIGGTAEVSFNGLGMNESPPTPTPPRDCPYICNMSVRKELRRKQIGRHLLNACEQLISLMSKQQEVYLHCRVVDQIPYNMYKKAGYRVVKKDNIFVWFALQRRKNLMCKKLLPRDTLESDNQNL